jgi:hypothetical protein
MPIAKNSPLPHYSEIAQNKENYIGKIYINQRKKLEKRNYFSKNEIVLILNLEFMTDFTGIKEGLRITYLTKNEIKSVEIFITSFHYNFEEIQ